MFRVGEETGTLDLQLETAAVYYHRELEVRVKHFTSLFEPAVIIFMGVVVGFVAVALISAMYGIYSQVKSVFSLQGGTSSRVSDSADAQVVSSNFETDVQNASLITSASTGGSPQCVPGSGRRRMEHRCSDCSPRSMGAPSSPTRTSPTGTVVTASCATSAKVEPTPRRSVPLRFRAICRLSRP
jgi:hypothetical protein